MKKRKTNFIKLGILLFGISLLLVNCEKEVIEIPTEEHSHNNFLNINIENLTFDKANNEKLFTDLKHKYKIDDIIFDVKKKKSSSKDFSNLDPSIDVSVIKKAETENYISYTMRIDAPANESNSFFNLVIQENNGVQEIFTIKYTPSENQTKTATKANAFKGTYRMSRGMCLPDQNGDCISDDSGYGGNSNTIEICYDVIVAVEVPCTGGGHYIGNSCECQVTDFSCLRAKYEYQTKEECYTENLSSSSNGNNTSHIGGLSDSNIINSNNNVITIPITEILPDGALDSILECITPNQSQTDWLNNELANQSNNVVDIWNYINENSCQESKDIIIESIDETILNNEDFEEVFNQKRQCKKIKNLFEDYPNYKQALIDLSGIVNQDYENGKFIDNSSSSIQDIPQGTGGKIDINLNPASPYVTIAHTHDALGNGIGTYSVFSFADLLVMSSLAKKGHIKSNKFVAFLMTAKGTRYALTINNTTKFKEFFYNAKLDAINGVVDMNKFWEMKGLSDDYYGKKTAVIKENNDDNNAVKIAFLQLLQNNNTGVSIFEANSSFDNFTALKLEDDNQTVTPNNCNK